MFSLTIVALIDGNHDSMDHFSVFFGKGVGGRYFCFINHGDLARDSHQTEHTIYFWGEGRRSRVSPAGEEGFSINTR